MLRLDLFWKRVERLSDDECWLWQGPISRDGYGNYTWKDGERSTGRRPHRIAYEQMVGPIPEGLTLDHLCRNRLCCNPKHLEPCERGENARRGETGQWKRDKTHCPHGHEYTGRNLMVTRQGHRQCRACTYARNSLARAHRKERVNA